MRLTREQYIYTMPESINHLQSIRDDRIFPLDRSLSCIYNVITNEDNFYVS
jgi:hypothetical protein